MASGVIGNISSNEVERNENDEKVKSDFDDAREQPSSLNPITITSNLS